MEPFPSTISFYSVYGKTDLGFIMKDFFIYYIPLRILTYWNAEKVNM